MIRLKKFFTDERFFYYSNIINDLVNELSEANTYLTYSQKMGFDSSIDEEKKKKVKQRLKEVLNEIVDEL